MGLLAPECAATLVPSGDGRGLGAAIVTAVALRLVAQRNKVERLLAPLRLSRADLERVQALMKQEMERGLDRESNATSSVRMLPTYVCHTPDGTGEEWGTAGKGPARVSVVLLASPICSTQREENSWRWTWEGPISVCWWCTWKRTTSTWPMRSTSSPRLSCRAPARRWGSTRGRGGGWELPLCHQTWGGRDPLPCIPPL